VTTRVAIIGTGKMGKLIASIAPQHDCTVVAHLGRIDTVNGVAREALQGAEVVIEFTVPHEAAVLVRSCAELGVPVVSGTTGWDAERPAVEEFVRLSRGALLWAPNFALGVRLFARIVSEAARRFAAQGGFEAKMVETHHAQKLDAPSGTARLLAGAMKEVSGTQISIESVRTGDVVGTHEVSFTAPYETVRLVHEATDRRVFASGALAAARWLKGRRGVHSLDEVLGDVR
jgi:4-hydroxy-tetrahydrodipicolinate reductase